MYAYIDLFWFLQPNAYHEWVVQWKMLNIESLWNARRAHRELVSSRFPGRENSSYIPQPAQNHGFQKIPIKNFIGFPQAGPEPNFRKQCFYLEYFFLAPLLLQAFVKYFALNYFFQESLLTSDKCKTNHIVGNSDLFWNVLYFVEPWMGGNTLPLSVKKVVGKEWCTEKTLFCSLGPNIKIIIKHFQYFWYIFALYWWKFKFLYLADNYDNHESIPLSVLSISLILEGFERKLTFMFIIKKNLKLNEFISNL